MKRQAKRKLFKLVAVVYLLNLDSTPFLFAPYKEKELL